MKRVFSLIFFLLLSIVVTSQDEGKANEYYENKQYEEAAFEFEEVLPFIEKEYGETDTSYYSKQVFNTASAFENSRQFPKAEKYYLIVKSIYEFHEDTLNQIYTLTLLNLGYSYLSMDLYEQSEQTNKRALKLVKIRSGENHMEYIEVLSNLANTYEKTGHFNLAEPLVQQAIEISRKELGKNSLRYARFLNHIGSIYNATGNYIKAISQINKALEIIEEQVGKNHSEYANYSSNLGITYLRLGNYVMAETLYKRAVEIIRPKPGEKFTNLYFILLNNLARLYTLMNRFTESEVLYLKIIELWDDQWSYSYATILSGCVSLYCMTEQYEKAESFLLKAIEIDKTILGIEHPNYARDLYILGNINTAMGQYKTAESNYIEAIEIVENKLNNNYPNYTIFINSLARLYTLIGDFEEAEVLFKEALEINKNQLGVNHPKYASTLNNLAELYIIQGDYVQANTLQRQAFNGYQYQIKNNTSYLSEKELKQFLHTFLYQLEIYQSLNSQQLQSQVAIGDFSYNIELIRKGILLKSSLGVKRRILESGDASLINTYYNLRSIKQKIDKVKMKKPEERTQDLDELESQANELEKILSLKSKDYQQSQMENEISWQDVKRNLKTGEAAIEFSSFHYFNGKESTDSILYCAIVLRESDIIPQMLYLCEESELLKIIPTAGANFRNINYTYKEPEMYKLIWQPINSSLEGIKTIYFAPTGLLNSVSMASILCPDNELLMDKFNLVQLSSTRELALPEEPISIDNAVIYGGINYDTDSLTLSSNVEKYKKDKNDLAYFRSYTGDLRSGFKYLPGSQQEAESISSILKEKDIPFTSYSGTEAVEESFLFLSGDDAPSVIHLSTHGFYFPDTVSDENRKNIMYSSTGEVQFRYNDDPLQRSGLLMAGSNLAWKGKTIPNNVEDGILTAKEVSNMNLMNTELVVLSACQSGLGDVKGSEGVEGLQRGFKMAGVRYIIMSLWQVPDKETTEFMETFYSNWLDGDDIHEAFRSTQITMKNKYPDDPFKWAGFVLME